MALRQHTLLGGGAHGRWLPARAVRGLGVGLGAGFGHPRAAGAWLLVRLCCGFWRGVESASGCLR